MCSTGCFAKFGSSHLDGLLQCSVESNDCVHVPGKENVGWNVDSISDLPSKPLVQFNPASMKGVWFKTMGLDSRYDCFDCQKNSFSLTDKDTLSMEAVFRIPRPNFPGYLQSKIEEELHVTNPNGANSIANMQSQGKMFGLTFWENWYVLGDTKYYRNTPQTGLISSAYASDNYKSKPDLKLVFYTGHTLQGSYKGESRATRITRVLIH
jgi:VDE lipocalin domain